MTSLNKLAEMDADGSPRSLGHSLPKRIIKIGKPQMYLLITMALAALLYVGGYAHFVHPMPVRMDGSEGETVQPVFHTARQGIINLFGPAVAVDQALFPGRWELRRFQLPPTNLAGLRAMRPFSARVESITRTMPHNTGITTLQLGLRLESGHFLKVVEPGATEPMFALVGSLMDHQVHEFPACWRL